MKDICSILNAVLITSASLNAVAQGTAPIAEVPKLHQPHSNPEPFSCRPMGNGDPIEVNLKNLQVTLNPATMEAVVSYTKGRAAILFHGTYLTHQHIPKGPLELLPDGPTVAKLVDESGNTATLSLTKKLSRCRGRAQCYPENGFNTIATAKFIYGSQEPEYYLCADVPF